MNQYVEREIHYTDDGRLMDGSYAIMMDWEKPVMEFQAEQICRNGGNVLNVGFGMGFIDDAIERYDIKGHTIIELHPGVQDEILKRGWAKKEHVKLLFGDWRKFLQSRCRFYTICWTFREIPSTTSLPFRLPPILPLRDDNG